MEEYRTISKNNPQFPPYLNFQTLRELGLKHLQELSGKIWTDYNLHDPGVTILEVLCYAITDLGYRNNLDIEDLLALKPGDKDSRENNFFTADQVLTCNPLTELDWHQRLIDIEGVRNAWLEKIALETYEPAMAINWDESRLQYYDRRSGENENQNRFYPRGLYRVWLDLEPTYRQDPCGQPYQSRSEVLEAVNQVLFSYRNLCEDFQEVMVLEAEEIGLCCDIELTRDADPEDVLVGIYVQVQKFLRPPVQFYTLKQLLDKGKNPGEIFAGRPVAIPSNDKSFPNWPVDPLNGKPVPYSHGFIDPEELSALMPPPVLHTSDLYQEILKVPGVAAVRKLRISSYINGLQQSEWESWCLRLCDSYYPTLGIDRAQVRLYKGELPLGVDGEEVKRRYFEQQEISLKVARDAYELDLPVPLGQYYETLADHYSIQHDFPLTYGIGEEGLPDNVSALRKAQAKQLKGYLVFFDQLLANYLSQLAHVRDLFSWESDNEEIVRSPEQQHTYFTQSFAFPGRGDILKDVQYLDVIAEDGETYRERRNRFLDHLLARFAESFAEYALLNYQVQQNGQDKATIETNLIEDKARFLQDYPTLARDRFRAFNYAQTPTWDTDNVSGFQQRIARLLGLNNVQRRYLSHYHLDYSHNIWSWWLRHTPDAQLLLASHTLYSTEAAAQTALEACLSRALEPTCYKHFTYRYSYHFGWDVVDAQGERVVRCDRFFPSQSERLAALEPLLASVSERLSTLPEQEVMTGATEEVLLTVSSEDFIIILGPDSEQRFSFRLMLPPVSPEQTDVISFTGIESYRSSTDANTVAVASLDQIRDRQNYRPSLLRSSDVGGDQPDTNRLFVYYGYAITDAKGNLLAQSPVRYPTEADCEAGIKRLQSLIQASESIEGSLVKHELAYAGRLENASGQTLLQGTQHFFTKKPKDWQQKVWQHSNALMELAQDRNNFQLIDSDDGSYGWELTTEGKDEILAVHHYASSAERDAALASLQTYIQDTYLKAEGFYVLEHILLRPRTIPQGNSLVPIAWLLLREVNTMAGVLFFRKSLILDRLLPICVSPEDVATLIGKPTHLIWQDPYSFWISIILPYWPTRFRKLQFRRFVERTLRLEAPAHVALRIAWLGPGQMRAFEDAYHAWLGQLALATQGTAYELTWSLNRLLDILSNLESVYPSGNLFAPEPSTTTNNPIILNQTMLGSTQSMP